MAAGQLGAYQMLGAQVRVLVTDTEVMVGAFPVLTPDEIEAMIATLDRWSPVDRACTSLVVGIYGTGEASVWGPAVASHPTDPSAPAAELVDAALTYLRSR